MRRWTQSFGFVAAALLGPLTIAAALPPAMAQVTREDAALDALFDQLRLAPDQARAQAIADRIWIYWTTPSDPMLAARMRDVIELRQRGDFRAVVALLDAIVTDFPDYAEGWNQRATVHYLLRDYEKSLADIEKVLQREPRHFGALVGRAMIYKDQGEDALALQDMAAALAIHPFLIERAMFPELESLRQV